MTNISLCLSLYRAQQVKDLLYVFTASVFCFYPKIFLKLSLNIIITCHCTNLCVSVFDRDHQGNQEPQEMREISGLRSVLIKTHI